MSYHMKKEYVIAALFIGLVVCAVVSNLYIGRLTRNVLELCSSAIEAADDGNWDDATAFALSACELWEENDKRTHIVLRHNVIETVDITLNTFCGFINARNYAEAVSAYRSVRAVLCGVEESEHIRLGSVF